MSGCLDLKKTESKVNHGLLKKLTINKADSVNWAAVNFQFILISFVAVWNVFNKIKMIFHFIMVQVVSDSRQLTLSFIVKLIEACFD